MIHRLTRQSDVWEIERLLRDPDIWENVSDDGSTFGVGHLSHLIRVPNMYFLVPIIENVRIGVFFFHPHNFITYEIHSMVRRESRGELARIGVLEAGLWMFTNTDCMKIITQVPEGNIRGKYLARRMGMKEEGVNRKSLLKHGKLLDQTMYGICKGDPVISRLKEEICQLQQ